MSLRYIGRTVFRFGHELVIGFGRNHLLKRTTAAIKAGTTAIKVGSRVNLPFSRNGFIRLIQRTIRGRYLARPFAGLHYRQRRFPTAAHRPWIVVSSSYKWPFMEHVKNVFGTNPRYNRSLLSEEYPNSLNGYEVGPFIACGCNAAVYQLKKSNIVSSMIYFDQKDLNEYPLALKIMFNYDFSLPERFIWRDMGSELIPLSRIPLQALQGRMGSFKPLRKNHPNLIKMHTAFIDEMPVLEGADSIYPEALPSADIFGYVINEPKTLLIVMKRYHMTLKEYVVTRNVDLHHGTVMLGQLLEAVFFLQQHKIVHRDMKSDNILLDFECEDEAPHLVLSDFGSAMTSTFYLSYDDEFTDLGGNLCLRAPEIRTSKQGDIIDYSRADLWAAGTLAYEIFTCQNPFYARLSSETYKEDDLPLLPHTLNNVIKSVISKVLRIDPWQRPEPEIAANVINFSLFRAGRDIRTFLEECGLFSFFERSEVNLPFSDILNQLGSTIESKLNDVIGLYAAETITAKLLMPNVFSPAELQLRATFLSRLERNQMWKSVEYFFEQEKDLN